MIDQYTRTIYTADDIAKDVRVCLDQNMASGTLALADDIDTLSLDEIIKSKILEGVRRVHLSAPNYLLDGGHNFGDAIHWADMMSGWVLLPLDFLRLIVFEMDDWERAVYTAISTDDPEYAKQRSRFKGIRGTAQNPVCAIAIRPEGRVLEFYSCKSENATVSRAVYLPEPVFDDGGGVYICPRCYTAVVYMVAALVLATYGNADKSNQYIELSKSALQ